MKERKFQKGDRLRVINTNGDIRNGEIHTCTGVTPYEVAHNTYGVYIEGHRGYFYSYRFELLPIETMTIEEQLKIANDLIGKEVITNDTNRRYTVTNVGVMTPKDKNLSQVSSNVIKMAKDRGYCVYVENATYSSPIDNVSIAPSVSKVKLNDNYEAIVTKDTIKVGCQTFPISILADLNNAYDSL